jgi:putative phage-type endonuclease
MTVLENQRAQFLATRRGFVGGTDIAAIVGVSNWASPLSVYLDKTAPDKSDDSDSLPMRRGLALEQFIADEFEIANPGFVTYRPKPIVRTDWGFPAGASIDRMVAKVERPRTPRAVLECKTAFGFASSKQWQAPDPAKGITAGDLPDGYYVQVQWYLAVSGLPVAYGAADTGDAALTIVPIEADEPVQARLIEAGREFWQNHVERGVAPAPDGSKSSADALNRMWPDTIPDPPVYIEDEAAEVLLSDYLAHKVKAEEHAREADTAKQQLQSLMGEHETAVVGGWKLSWKRQTQHVVDTKRLKAEKPEIAAEYMKESESRPFAAPKEVTE